MGGPKYLLQQQTLNHMWLSLQWLVSWNTSQQEFYLQK